MKKLLLNSIFCLLSFLVGTELSAQERTISGTIRNQEGQAITMASVIIGDKHVFSDTSGFFKIGITEETDHILVKARNYLPKRVNLAYNYNEQLSIVLDVLTIDSTSSLNIDSLIDILYFRSSINSIKYSEFSSSTYSKNKAMVSKVPFEIWRVSGKYMPAKEDTGIIYASEKYSKQYFESNNNFFEDVEAVHFGGKVAFLDWQNLADHELNFNQNYLYLKALSKRPFPSPLSKKSKDMYIYEYLGSYYEGSNLVYRIRFEPKVNYTSTFAGEFGIYEQTFNLAYTDIRLNKTNVIGFLDSMSLYQSYYLFDTVYSKTRQEEKYFMSLFGFKGSYDVNRFYKDYVYRDTRNPSLDKYLSLRTDSADILMCDSLWAHYRAYPASTEEKESFNKNDFNYFLKEEYNKPSELRANREKFRPFYYVFTGYEKRRNNYYIDLYPLTYMFGINTVEGPYLRYDAPITFTKYNRRFNIQPELRYGFNDNTLRYRLSSTIYYNPNKPRQFIFEAGKIISQFNENEPISPLLNTLYTFGLGSNYAKFYGAEFIELGHSWDVANGLEFTITGEYAQRYALFNNPEFSFHLGEGEDFTPNNPDLDDVINPQSGFDAHNSLRVDIVASYQFNQLYRLVNNWKTNEKVFAPQLYFNYSKGVRTGFSSTNFDFMELGYKLDWRKPGTGLTRIDVSMGDFFNAEKVEFIDYKHFDGAQILFLQPTDPSAGGSVKSFSTLPYYDFSTTDLYLEAHFEHFFDGQLLRKIEMLRPFNMHSFVGLNYLITEGEREFIEFVFGVSNILNSFRLEIAGGLIDYQSFTPSIRLGFDLDPMYYRHHKADRYAIPENR